MEEVVQAAYSPVPALLVLGPLLGAALVYPLGRLSASLRNALVVLVTALTALGAATLIPLVGEYRKITCVIPALLGELTFTVDSFGMLFALFTSFVWFCATLYALDYMKHEQKHDRFYTATLVVLAANMGVVLAGDLVTLYLCFEALGLVAYLLVVHTETDDAKKASVKYFWMTVVGGFALIGGIFLTFALGGTGAIGPLPAGHGDELLRWTAAMLLILGFGVKAGMVPVHVWLPDAHPVAPSPASALLSGVMIKAGAYGIFRVVTALFRPEVGERIEEGLWHFTTQLGLVVLWIGIATMFIGVCLALLQHNAKRMLAYHSVSQMGFILAGIGVAGYLGAEGAMGYAGGLYHIVNHALFKACLFLGVGAVFIRTGSLDMYHLGGLWKKMPLAFLFTLIAACGITGVPLFNGFVSKCLVHHAIVEAWELHGLASLGIAEKIYVLTCGGTACSFIKLIGLVFLGRPKVEYGPEVKDAPPRMLVAMGLLAAAIIVLGVRPDILIRGVFEPGLHTWGLETAVLEHYLQVYFLSGSDLLSVVYAFAIGVTVFVVGMKFGLFGLHGPEYLSVDYWYRRTARGLLAFCAATDGAYEALRSATSRGLKRAHRAYVAGVARFDPLRSATSRELTRARWAYRTGVARISRERRRLLSTFFTGAPGPRDEHFIQHAYVALERERQDTVRVAVRYAIDELRRQGESDALARRGAIDAVRDIASHIALRLFQERMGVLSDLARTGDLQSARAPFERIRASLAALRVPVAETALRLAPVRMAGKNVTREISATVNALIGGERFDLLLAPESEHMPSAYGSRTDTIASIRHATPARSALDAARAGGLTALERAGAWAIEIARISVDAVTRERSGSTAGDHLREATIVETRLRIQRYTRDLSLSVAVIVAVLLLFVAALAASV